MNLKVLIGLGLALAACSSIRHDSIEVLAPNSRAAQQFEQLKQLEGEWISVAPPGSAQSDMMTGARVDYRMTAAGQTLIETCFVGQPHEMVTNYYLDGEQLVLTHYCMLGNQPHMIAAPGTDENTVAFACVGGGNLNDCVEQHMHKGVYTFNEDGSVNSAWTLFENGEAGDTHAIRLVRR